MKKNIPWVLCWIALGWIGGTVCGVVLQAENVVDFLNKNSGAVTAVFTIILGISTVGLWQATHRLWGTAELQIEAAKDSINLARETRVHELRAYVTASSFTVPIDLMDADGWLMVRLEIHNVGQTPANSLVIHYGSDITLPDDLPAERNYRNRSGAFQLASGKSFKTEFSILIPPDNDGWARLRSREVYFHIFGEVEYVDVFGHKRVSQFFETTGAGASDPEKRIHALGAVEAPLTFT